MQNILVIMLRYIGDVLLATPVARALRERYPAARITLAVNPGTEDILRGNPDVDDVIIVRRNGLRSQLRFLKTLRARNFDCVIDLTDGDRSAVLSWSTRAPRRIGFNQERRWRGLLYSSVVRAPVAGMHRVERNLEALRALGMEPKSPPLVLRPSPADDREASQLLQEVGVPAEGPIGARPLVMLHPGARYWFKSWPAERFAALADLISEKLDGLVLIGGGDTDGEVAAEIRRRSRSAPILLAGRTTLMQLAAVLKRCQLFVGNDNGPMHMAAALQVPVVALFGPSDPRVWGPRGVLGTVLYKGLDCRRCYHPTCFRGEESCMRQISVEEVCEASKQLLEVSTRPLRNSPQVS